jgi:HSP20 family protein
MANIARYHPLDDLVRGFFVRPVEFGSAPYTPQMQVDVKDGREGYVVHAELPGRIKKEDIHVSIIGPVVSIAAERRQEKAVREVPSLAMACLN